MMTHHRLLERIALEKQAKLDAHGGKAIVPGDGVTKKVEEKKTPKKRTGLGGK